MRELAVGCGGVDLDTNNNAYPDLLIGAYGSSAVVAILARPITNIKTEVQSTELKNIDPQSQGCPSDPETNLACFSIKACCSAQWSHMNQFLSSKP